MLWYLVVGGGVGDVLVVDEDEGVYWVVLCFVFVWVFG